MCPPCDAHSCRDQVPDVYGSTSGRASVRIPRALRSRAIAREALARRIRSPNLGHDRRLARVRNLCHARPARDRIEWRAPPSAIARESQAALRIVMHQAIGHPGEPVHSHCCEAHFGRNGPTRWLGNRDRRDRILASKHRLAPGARPGVQRPRCHWAEHRPHSLHGRACARPAAPVSAGSRSQLHARCRRHRDVDVRPHCHGHLHHHIREFVGTLAEASGWWPSGSCSFRRPRSPSPPTTGHSERSSYRLRF